MKKLKKILAAVSAAAVMMTGAVSVCAEEGFKSEGYDEYVKSLGCAEGINGLAEFYKDRSYGSYDLFVTGVYGEGIVEKNTDSVYKSVYEDVVFELSDEYIRTFAAAELNFSELGLSRVENDFDETDVNSFLKEKGFRATCRGVISLELVDSRYKLGEPCGLLMSYPDDITHKELIDTIFALNDKFGAVPQYDDTFSLENNLGQTSFYNGLLGDMDKDGSLNIRDAAMLARMIVSGEKISSRGDFNQDCYVNVRDAAAVARELAAKK